MTTTQSATFIESVSLEVTDPEAALRFYTSFGVQDRISLTASGSPSSGFRGFTLAVNVAQPANVDLYLNAAVEAGATVLKPAGKSLWGYGGVVQAPDGTMWKIATSAKKDTSAAMRKIDAIILLLGVDDVRTSKKFYVEKGMVVKSSFGGTYADFTSGTPDLISLALYKRSGLAKDLGVAIGGTGSHQIILTSTPSQAFADPDNFEWTINRRPLTTDMPTR